MNQNNLEDLHKNKYCLWGGRFETGNDELMKLFNASLPVDKRLWKEDIQVLKSFFL
jgi:argininosuccinate lyase